MNSKQKYVCDMCNFSCYRLLHYETHLKTQKHQKHEKKQTDIRNLIRTVEKQNEYINNLSSRIDSLESKMNKFYSTT